IDPCIPPAWKGFEAWIRPGGPGIHVILENPHPAGTGGPAGTPQGAPLDSNRVRLDPGIAGEHEVRVRLGKELLTGEKDAPSRTTRSSASPPTSPASPEAVLPTNERGCRRALRMARNVAGPLAMRTENVASLAAVWQVAAEKNAFTVHFFRDSRERRSWPLPRAIEIGIVSSP